MFSKTKTLWACLAIGLPICTVSAQTTQLRLADFSNNKGSWSEVGDAWANPLGAQQIQSSGQGTILVNQPAKKKPGMDLVSNEKFGDAEVTLVYMMAPGSNSGLYLQGQYEIQLLDSWTTTDPKAGDNGGIYERWDESKPDGQKGYQGYAPRQNATKAPGTWQELKVLFKAPKFSASGEKIANARIESVVLNGVLIHEDVELFGPTRGALPGGEVAEGPIRIQGDHGPVAIQSLTVKPMDTPAPTFSAINFEVYPGSFEEMPSASSLTAANKGTISDFDEFSTGLTQESLAKLETKVSIKKAGNYTFLMSVPNGLGSLQIGTAGGATLQRGIRVEKQLEAGEYPVTIWVSKPRDWTTEGFSLSVNGDTMWPTEYSNPAGSFQGWPTDPILVDTEQDPVLRSFIEVPDAKKISHGISVSSPFGTSYSYDLNSNELIRVWRGGFLDATPMWNSRGNGVSRPMGAVTELSKGEELFYNASYSPLADDLKSKGYEILGPGALVFKAVNASGAEFRDKIQVIDSGKGIERSISYSAFPAGTLVKVAPGQELVEMGDGLYWVKDSGLFLSVGEKVKPVAQNGAVYLPASSTVTYRLLF